MTSYTIKLPAKTVPWDFLSKHILDGIKASFKRMWIKIRDCFVQLLNHYYIAIHWIWHFWTWNNFTGQDTLFDWQRCAAFFSNQSTAAHCLFWRMHFGVNCYNSHISDNVWLRTFLSLQRCTGNWKIVKVHCCYLQLVLYWNMARITSNEDMSCCSHLAPIKWFHSIANVSSP